MLYHTQLCADLGEQVRGQVKYESPDGTVDQIQEKQGRSGSLAESAQRDGAFLLG